MERPRSKLVFAYNTINRSSGYSPFFLMLRRSSKLQIDRIVQKRHNNQKSCDKFIAEWKESM